MEKDSLTGTGLVILGGSAGSLEVLLATLPELNINLSVPIVIVVHRSSDADPMLQALLASKTIIPVKEVEEKEPVKPGMIYIAPADYHLLIEKDHTFSLDYSEKINYSRPSIDVTFEIAADVYGSMLTCLLLSGGNMDGTQGLLAVKAAGGITAIQDPSTAAVPFMPQSALAKVSIDHILGIREIAPFINNLTINH